MAAYSPTEQAWRKLNNRYQETKDELNDHMSRMSNGESVEKGEFANLVEKIRVTHQGMSAQLKLHEKQVKTVLNEK